MNVTISIKTLNGKNLSASSGRKKSGIEYFRLKNITFM